MPDKCSFNTLLVFSARNLHLFIYPCHQLPARGCTLAPWTQKEFAAHEKPAALARQQTSIISWTLYPLLWQLFRKTSHCLPRLLCWSLFHQLFTMHCVPRCKEQIRRKQKHYNSLHFFMCKAEEHFYRTGLRTDSATSGYLISSKKCAFPSLPISQKKKKWKQTN